MPSEFIVGPTGLPLWRYPDWRALREQRWREAYGPDVDTRPEAPDGLQVDTLTLGDTLHHDATQSVWANSFFRTAEGPALDLILDLFSRLRIPAAASTVDAIWYGDPGTVVWDGSGSGTVAVVESVGTTNGDRYATTAAATLSDPEGGAPVVYELLETVEGEDYGVELDANSVFAPAPSDDPLEAAQAVVEALEAAYPAYSFTAALSAQGTGLVVILTTGGEVVEVSGDMTNQANGKIWGSALVPMRGEVTGARQVLAGSLTALANPIAGIEGVINLADGTLGRAVETDAEYRARHVDQINVGGKGTPQRIRAAALALGPDLVEFARVDQNTRPVTHLGRPPHSFELTVIGNATDDQIGAVVLDQKPAGIQAYGTTTVIVEDEVGENHVLNFSRGTELYLHLDLEIEAGEGFPSGDPSEAVIEAVVQYLTDVLTMGQGLYLITLAAPVLATLSGVASITVTAGTTASEGDPTPALAGTDIAVASNEVLRVSSTRITVSVV